MRHISKCLLVFLLISLAMSTSVWAQGTAQITGNVKDATGAVLPGVDITATQTATGTARTTITDETGSYTLTALPIGPYRIEAGLPGFRTYVQTGLNLEINASPALNIVLEVGQVSEQVEVQANAALVETRTVGVGQIMEQERILELPLNGRNVTELITLGGAAVQTGTSDSRSMPGQQAIRVAGGQAGSVAYSLDGATHNNPYDNLSLPLPFPDALQEFKVETSALSASQGQHSGAQVNAVTRSGTNEFHGSLFEFVRNDLFNARQYFAQTQSTLKRNQFGGTFGGPIVRNKLFFFGGYQGGTIRSDPADIKRWVPTAAALNGDFSAIASARCNTAARTMPAAGLALGFPADYKFNPASFSPAAVKLAKLLPTPIDECGLVIYGNQQKDNDGQYIGKGDWQITPNHAFVGRVLFTGNTRAVPHDLRPDNLLNAGGTSLGFDNLAQSYTIGDTWLKSPETVVSGRLSVHYTNVQRLGAKIMTPTDLGVKNHFSYLPDYLLITMTDPGFPLGGGTQSFSTFRTFTTGMNADVTMSRGSHQAAYGGTIIYVDSNSNANVLSPGSFGFTGKYTNVPLADFLLGRAATYAQSAPNTNYVRMWYMASYFADTWKVTPRLTLNYGVRWEPDNGEVLTLARIQNYSEERRIARIRSKVFTQAPYGFHYLGDEGFPGKRGRNLNWLTFAPRFGFALDVNGDGKMSIRGSGGIAYEKPNAQFHLWTSIAPPWGANVNLQDVLFDDPWATFPGGNPFPASYSQNAPFVASGEFTAVPYDLIKPSQVQSWNISLQRQLGSDFLISASYLGNHTIHMLDTVPLNPAVYIPGQCVAGQYGLTAAGPCSTTANTNARRRITLSDPETGALVSNLAEIRSEGTASYNGLLLDFRKRATRGITINGNYTWSHCISSEQDLNGGTGVAPNNTYTIPGDRERARGNCAADRRHVTNITSVVESPRFEGRALRLLASDWRLSTIYRYSTGPFLSVSAGNSLDLARNGTNVNSQPANYIGGDPYGDTSGGPNTQWFNKDAFAAPAIGTLGNSGFRRFLGPATWQFDTSLSRAFQIREGHRLEFRAEAYNITNSFRATNPNTAQNNGLFGLINDSLDTRKMQFALKYVF